MTATNVERARPSWSRLIVKWVVLCIALVFISRRAIELWESAPPESISINWVWLFPAGISYFVGWLPSVWLWMAFLRSMHQPIDFRTAIRAYYVGHLGKYVPGKALALVIRGAMVEDKGVNPLLAGVTGACETLVYMASGTALGLVMLPWTFAKSPATSPLQPLTWIVERPLVLTILVVTATFATTPLSAWFMTRLCRKTLGRVPTSGEQLPAISVELISTGVVVTWIGWLFHALSLGFVLQSISNQPFDISRFPVWLGVCSLSMVGGFVVLLAPGGIGVREGILIEALKDQPTVGPAMAVVAAALLRAVWFITELTAAGILYFAKQKDRQVTKRGTQSL